MLFQATAALKPSSPGYLKRAVLRAGSPPFNLVLDLWYLAQGPQPLHWKRKGEREPGGKEVSRDRSPWTLGLGLGRQQGWAELAQELGAHPGTAPVRPGPGLPTVSPVMFRHSELGRLSHVTNTHLGSVCANKCIHGRSLFADSLGLCFIDVGFRFRVYFSFGNTDNVEVAYGRGSTQWFTNTCICRKLFCKWYVLQQAIKLGSTFLNI